MRGGTKLSVTERKKWCSYWHTKAALWRTDI